MRHWHCQPLSESNANHLVSSVILRMLEFPLYEHLCTRTCISVCVASCLAFHIAMAAEVGSAPWWVCPRPSTTTSTFWTAQQWHQQNALENSPETYANPTSAETYPNPTKSNQDRRDRDNHNMTGVGTTVTQFGSSISSSSISSSRYPAVPHGE